MMLANGQQVALFGLGAEGDSALDKYASSPVVKAYLMVRSILTPIIIGGAAYHGYKRNDSWLWAAGWAALAGFAPVLTTGVALAQGYGKAKR